ncbi:hypothetical protein VIBNISFn27_p10179 [Vibrio nigripulchritudo SFn27]|nr:hypothetical protein VIBNISFn27_p10179 [Vibrio nigripulchritudo SFn27]CCO44042.1 putative regulator [Vibrio nigripulchritudo SFn135]
MLLGLCCATAKAVHAGEVAELDIGLMCTITLRVSGRGTGILSRHGS